MAELDRLLRRPPDPDRLRPGEELLAGCARAAAPGERAPVLAVLALLAWYRGHGVRARLLVEEGNRDLWAAGGPPPGGTADADVPGDGTEDGDSGGRSGGDWSPEGDGVSLLDLVEGLLVWAASPPWATDRPNG
jgi:hypothetical protein